MFTAPPRNGGRPHFFAASSANDRSGRCSSQLEHQRSSARPGIRRREHYLLHGLARALERHREAIEPGPANSTDELEYEMRLRADEVVDVAALLQRHGANRQADRLDELEHPEVTRATQVRQRQHRDALRYVGRQVPDGPSELRYLRLQ